MQVVISRRTVLLLPLVLLFTLAAVASLVFLPRARIMLTPQTSQRQVAQEITLSTAATEPDFAKFVLPARKIEKTLEEQRVVTREGAETIDDFARGRVVLVNDLDEEQPLLPKTHLRHEATGVFFLTDTPVTLAPKSRVAMTVTAKEMGEAGNVPPGKFLIDKLPARTQQAVYAESETPMTGGVIIESPLTEAEITVEKELLLGELTERLRGELTLAAGGAAIRPELLQIAIEEESLSAEAGSKTREFTLRLKVTARALVAAEADLLSLTLLALRGMVDPEAEFVSYAPDSFRLEVTRVDFERGEARITGSLTGTYAAKIGPSALRADNLAGLSADEVRSHFADNPQVGEAAVEFSPFWVRSVPSRPAAVEVAIQEPAR